MADNTKTGAADDKTAGVAAPADTSTAPASQKTMVIRNDGQRVIQHAGGHFLPKQCIEVLVTEAEKLLKLFEHEVSVVIGSDKKVNAEKQIAPPAAATSTAVSSSDKK